MSAPVSAAATPTTTLQQKPRLVSLILQKPLIRQSGFTMLDSNATQPQCEIYVRTSDLPLVNRLRRERSAWVRACRAFGSSIRAAPHVIRKY